MRQIPGVTCTEPQGAFCIFPNVSAALREDGVRDTLEFSARLLQHEHVTVVPGEAFGLEGHVRISYATSMHELERGLARLENFIRHLMR